MNVRRQSRLELTGKPQIRCVLVFVLALFVFAAVSEPAFAGNPYSYTWAASGMGDGYITPSDIAVDENENTYIAGRFNGSYRLGEVSLDNKGERKEDVTADAFVARLDADGKCIWASHAGAPPGRNSEACAIAVDRQGNSYITGYFRENISFGAITLEAGGELGIFVAKLDRCGNWLWARGAGGSYANSIALDQQNNIYVTGAFGGTADFGGYILTTDNNCNIFVAKLDSDGNWLWAKEAGAYGSDGGFGYVNDNRGQAITVGANDAVFVAGSLAGRSGIFGDITFDWETNTTGKFNSFVACMDTDGQWLWVVPYLAQSPYGGPMLIAADQDGNCYVAGEFDCFEYGNQIYYSSAHTDVFTGIINEQGKWVRFIRSGKEGPKVRGLNHIYGLAVDAEGNVYVAGQNSENIKFGEIILENEGSYIAKWDAAKDDKGEWDWAKPAGGTILGMAMNARNQLYVTGKFKGNAVVFDNITLENTQYGYAENLFVTKAEDLNGSSSLPAGFPYFAFSKWEAEPVVSQNHIFKVKFSLPISPGVLENDAIYVRTAQNEVVPVTLQFAGVEQDTVQIEPLERYLTGKTYYLYIDADKISSSPATGAKQLPDTIVMKFTIQS